MSVTAVSRLTLSQLLSPNTIELSLRSRERDGVFAELIERIPDLTRRPDARQALLRALEEREKLGSTGLGHGIALPHTRNSISGMGGQPVIVFGRHAQGIAYGAADGAPVRLLFLLVAPTISVHLQILARLSRVLREETLRRDLLAVGTREEVLVLIREAEGKAMTGS